MFPNSYLKKKTKKKLFPKKMTSSICLVIILKNELENTWLFLSCLVIILKMSLKTLNTDLSLRYNILENIFYTALDLKRRENAYSSGKYFLFYYVYFPFTTKYGRIFLFFGWLVFCTMLNTRICWKRFWKNIFLPKQIDLFEVLVKRLDLPYSNNLNF